MNNTRKSLRVKPIRVTYANNSVKNLKRTNKNKRIHSVLTNIRKPISLTPKEEAYMVCYIALYYNCDIETCWKEIANIILKYGSRTNKLVFRGHDKKDNTIRNIRPFFSTTPNQHMAELFVEKNWDLPEDKQRVGHLFRIHLTNALWLSTRNIHYKLTDEVKEELSKINNGRLIEKGHGTFTFEEFFPRIKGLIEELVFADEKENGEEILVLNGGTFYSDRVKETKGLKPINANDFETWYSLSD